MPVRVGYIGKTNDAVGWWDYDWRVPVAVNSNHTLTIHDCNYRPGSYSYEDSYATTNDPVIVMEADEYPTSVQFGGYASYVAGWYNLHESYSGSVTICLCHSSGQAVYSLTPFASLNNIRPHESNIDSAVHPISNGTVFAGKALDIYVTGDRQICLRNQCKAIITTDYAAKSISAVNAGNGSVSVSASTAKRGNSVTVTANPAFGYVVDGVEATAGTLTQTSANTWTFTMPTPAQDVTITARFSVEPHKTVKYHDGTGFVECIPHVYDGSEFKEVEPYYYNGTEWVLCSQT